MRAAPLPPASAEGRAYWTRDYETSFAELRKTMAWGIATGEAARANMLAGYRRLLFDQASGYRQVFAHLKAGEVPVIFNCSAGKDRAGTAAALVLSALGTPRAVVIEDFALTNEVANLHRVLTGGVARARGLAGQPADVVDAILTADPTYIAAALAEIEARHGSIETYFADVLNVSAQELEEIRDRLLD